MPQTRPDRREVTDRARLASVSTGTTDPICPPGTRFALAVEAARADGDVATAAWGLVGELTDDELLWLLDGDTPLLKGLIGIGKRYNEKPYEAGRVDRLGIPGIRFTDGPRGVVMGNSTAFPVALARAATWDVDLERRIGDAIGAEARAQGANLFAGICINLAPAPGWGRSQESYGEDPLLLGAMGAALADGVNPWVMSCVKHFALNSMEDARFIVDVEVAEEVLHEVYLPHFQAVAEVADAVMSAYNCVNGTWAGENRYLLHDVLREMWGFSGFVMSDFVWGLRDPVGSVSAGQDLEMPFRQQRAHALPDALLDGRLERRDAHTAAHRLLAAQIRLALRARPAPPGDVVACGAHRDLAREAATKAAVLLRNEPVGGVPALPLDPASTIAVVGPLADSPNLGDVGSSQVFPPSSVSVLAGLRERAEVVHAGGDIPTAVAAARSADAAVVVVGLSSQDEGESMTSNDAESIGLLGGPARSWLGSRLIGSVLSLFARLKHVGGDRRDLHLHREDVELVEAVAGANPRTVVVVIGGGTIMCDPWEAKTAAILLAWYPGMEGGRAIADILLGDREPGGRLPVAIPRRRADLPVVDWNARRVAYPHRWGQRRLDSDAVEAAYPFGYGLGYTDIVVRGMRLIDERTAEVRLANTGPRDGRQVVQLYARQAGNDLARTPVLVGFAPVEVAAGSTAVVRVPWSDTPLRRWNGQAMELGDGPITLIAGRYAGDPEAVTA